MRRGGRGEGLECEVGGLRGAVRVGSGARGGGGG